ncbi:MAG: (d)CMP kinase, partial [Janthinobacterium lividum]
DGTDVTGDIRTPEVTAAASRISVHGPVRDWMVSAQRALGRDSPRGLVMEGRDIGTVVFPEADVKLFLDASLESRGDRRFAQGTSESKSALLNEMRDRDNRDRSREQSPLVPAADAILLDTTTLTLEQVIASVESIVQETLSSRQSST